jgi:hypothetical protein
MGFGSSSSNDSGEREITFERRDLVFVDQEDKRTSGGKVYWRVKDNVGKGRFYSVWEAELLAQLQDLQGENNTPVPCVVKVEKLPDGKVFYSITDCGVAAETVAAASNEKQQVSRQPGGRNSEFGKRMHPDDALRVTNLALEGRAMQFIELIIDDRPEGMTREQFAKGKLMPIMQFLGEFIAMPRTMTPDSPAPKTEEAPATKASTGFGANPTTTDFDDDIPF